MTYKTQVAVDRCGFREQRLGLTAPIFLEMECFAPPELATFVTFGGFGLRQVVVGKPT